MYRLTDTCMAEIEREQVENDVFGTTEGIPRMDSASRDRPSHNLLLRVLGGRS